MKRAAPVTRAFIASLRARYSAPSPPVPSGLPLGGGLTPPASGGVVTVGVASVSTVSVSSVSVSCVTVSESSEDSSPATMASPTASPITSASRIPTTQRTLGLMARKLPDALGGEGLAEAGLELPLGSPAQPLGRSADVQGRALDLALALGCELGLEVITVRQAPDPIGQ